MFGKTLSMGRFCSVLAVCSMLGMTEAMPVHRRSSALFQRDVQPGQTGMVGLLDQYKNLAEQVAGSTKGTADYINLTAKMNSTKADLETKIKGIAVLVDSPAASSSSSASAALPVSSSAPATGSTTAPASSITTSPGSANKIKTGGPVTIVTQVGTSYVVVASQGTTSTFTLAAPTNKTSAQATATVTVTGSGSGAASATFDINTMPAPDRLSSPQPTATKSP